MSGTATPKVVQLAPYLGHCFGSTVVVDGHPDELGAGVGERSHLECRGVGIGCVGVGHRLDDDRMRGADQDATHVDGRRLPANDVSHQVRRTMSLNVIHTSSIMSRKKPVM